MSFTYASSHGFYYYAYYFVICTKAQISNAIIKKNSHKFILTIFVINP